MRYRLTQLGGAMLLCGAIAVGSMIVVYIPGWGAQTGQPSAAAAPASPLTTLVDHAAARLQTADPVAASKYLNGGAVDDPAREQQVIDTVSADAMHRQLDDGYVRDVFRDQIDATDSVEHSRFAQWKINLSQPPANAPDLNASRETIDQLNGAIVAEISVQWRELNSPGCHKDLRDATASVIASRQLDDTYRQALAYATHRYCS